MLSADARYTSVFQWLFIQVSLEMCFNVLLFFFSTKKVQKGVKFIFNHGPDQVFMVVWRVISFNNFNNKFAQGYMNAVWMIT